jgi:hypothetical protein
MRNFKTLKKLWKAVEQFTNLISRDFDVAIEWPQNCPSWRFPRVVKFINEHSMQSHNFHGCMLGVVDHDGTPIKKPWAVATSLHEIRMEYCPDISVTDLTSTCKGGENHSKKLRVDYHSYSLTVCT